MADEQIVTSIVAKADLSSLVSEVHRATASLQQLQRELLTSNKSIAAATKVAQNAFRDTLTKSGMYSSHFVNLQSDVDKFGKNLDAGRLKLRDYFQTFRTHLSTTGGMMRELAKEQVMLQNSILQPLGRNAQGLMQYNVMIPRGLDAVKSKMQLANMETMIMNRALAQGSTALINWGKNTQWAGRQLTVGLTVPLAMFGAQAARAFREADQELTRLVKVYGDISGTASADLQKIRQDVTKTAKELSTAMGVSFKETIGLAADIAATGQQGEQLLGSLKETTRLAVLGEVDRAEAMKATLAIQTAFKSNTQELTESINFLNAVENQTSTTLNDLVDAIPKAGTVVKQLGGDVQDLALYLTAMREGGVNASEAANALKSGLASMINPTKQTIGVMSDFGIDIMGMVQKNTGDTTGMIMDLQKALDGLDPLSKARALEQMFGKFQFARMAALFNNLGKEGSQTLQVMNLMNASASQLADVAGRELSLVTESASGKYRRAIEGLRASLADVGEEFLGVATKFINAFTKVLDFFNNLPDPIKKAVTYLGGFTAVIGPIIMLTGVLANFFGYITKGVVSLRSFFMGMRGWKMLTPEMIAAEKAAQMVEKSFYSDAAAAEVLHGALTKLITDYRTLQQAMVGGVIPLNPTVTTPMGNPIMGRRTVDPTNVYAGAVDTRSMSHIIPRDPARPASIFGGVPGATPVNQTIGRNMQIYMDDALPSVPGVTTVKGVSTGIVASEAARFHALMATLGMQTEAEVAALKKTIALGGTVSSQLLDTFDDILPITSRLSQNAATQSAAIVAELRAGKITVDAAKAQILAVNAQLEQSLMSEVSAYAGARGRTIDFYKAPLMNQPVVDANGQFTLRDLYKKENNKAVMEEFGRLRGIRTFGAPYSIHTTRIPRFEQGGDIVFSRPNYGDIESFGPNKTQVSGPSSVSYDDRLGSVPVGGYVLNQQASMDPANRDLVSMASATFNDGGNIVAALTPKETVYGPNIHKIPGLYEAVDAANNGYNFGGQIMRGIANYGAWDDYKSRAAIANRYDVSADWTEEAKFRMKINAASALTSIGVDPKEAVKMAHEDVENAYSRSTSKTSGRVSRSRFKQEALRIIRERQRKLTSAGIQNRLLGVGPGTMNLHASQIDAGSISLLKELAGDPNIISKLKAGEIDRIYKSVFGITTDNLNNLEEKSLLNMLRDKSKNKFASEHMSPRDIAGKTSKSGAWGFNARGNYLQAMAGESDVNWMHAQLGDVRNRKLWGNFVAFDNPHAKSLVDWAARTSGVGNMQELRESIRRGSVGNRSFLQFLSLLRNPRFNLMPRASFVDTRLNKGGMIPGGSITRGRYGYGNPMSLINAGSMLNILKQAKQMSSKEALGSFANMPVAGYSHQIAPSSGKSFPIPGVSGLYKNENGDLVFFKGVPNEISAKAEMYGTRMAREVFGLDSPTQTIRTIINPLDPTGKSKLLGLESPFNPIFSAGGTKFTPDQMIRQTIASLVMGNKDLSKTNVFGNVLADVGPAGVFSRASMNSTYATNMHSMEQQALINLLGVRGGARKDFAYNTKDTAASMTSRQYGAKMKSAMKSMRPKLLKFIESLPESDRAPYMSLLSRFDEGMNVNWSQYHKLHSAPKYNRGGGIVRPGRYSYGINGDNRNRKERRAAERAQRKLQGLSGPAPKVDALGNPIRPQLQGMKPVEVPEGKEYRRFGGYTYADFQARFGNRGLQPIAPIFVDNVETVGMSKKGGRVITNVPVPVDKGLTDMSRILRLTSIGNLAVIDKLSKVLEKPLIAIRNAIIFQNKKLIEAPKLTGYTGGKALVHVPGLGKTYGREVATVPTYSNRFNAAASALAAKNMLDPMGRPMGFGNLTGTEAYKAISLMASYDKEGKYIGGTGFQQSRLARLLGQQGIGRDAMRQAGRYASAWKVVDADRGIYERKGPGILGLRRREFAQVSEDGTTRALTRGEAHELGYRKNFQMGIGTQMGLMMGSQVGGMALMQQDPSKKILGMNPQMAGMALMGVGGTLPFMAPAMMKGVNNLIAARKAGGLGSALGETSTLFKFLSPAKFLAFSGALVAATAAIVVMRKMLDNWAQDARNRFGLTAKAAEQLGIEHINLAQKMKAINAANAAANASRFSGMTGVPGLMMKPEELGKLAEEAKSKYGELIETMNRADSTNFVQLMLNIKAQMLGAGKSVEETNKAILGMVAASNHADKAFKVFSNSGFTAMTDRASAARQLFKQLRQEIDNPGDQFGVKMTEGFTYLMNNADAAIKSLVGTKNAQGEVIDEAMALNTVMKEMSTMSGYDKIIGTKAFSVLPKELQAILNDTDTIGSSIAKWQLYVQNTNFDLKNMSAETANALVAWNAAFDSAATKLQEAGGSDNTFGRIGSALARLQKTQDAVSAKAQRASQLSQRNAQKEIDLINKKIKAIDDEANAKLKALRATQDRENYQLELQKLQLEYQDAIARGDMATGARIQLDIQQLTKNRQIALAEQAILDAAEKKKKPLQTQIEKINASETKKQQGFQDAQYNAQASAKTMDAIKKYDDEYQSLLRERSTIAASDFDALQKNQNAINDFVSRVQTAGMKKGELGKELRGIFDWMFASGEKVNFGAPTNIPKGTPSHLGDLVYSANQSKLNVNLNRDLSAVNAQAEKIVKGITGGTATLASVVSAIRQDKGNYDKAGRPVVTKMYGQGATTYNANVSGIQNAKVGTKFVGADGKTYSIRYVLPNGEAGLNLLSKNKGGPIPMPRYNVGGPVKYAGGGMVTPNRRNYGNALYNINVELNGSNLDAQDVARAIRKEMEIRELVSGPGRKY
jgi:TP901 family phage tail tape measure protein